MSNDNDNDYAAQMRRTEENMRKVAQALDANIPQLFGKRYGFAFILFEQDEQDRTNFISNCPREDVVKALRATADRLAKDVHPGNGPSSITHKQDTK